MIVTAGETHAISIDGDAAERVVLSVEDGVLTQNVYTLRQALGTGADGKQMIENVPRR